MPYDPLPASVQQDLDNPALSTVTFPAGDYKIVTTGIAGPNNSYEVAIGLRRSNVTVNAAGCTLHYYGEDNVGSGVSLFSIRSKLKTTTYGQTGSRVESKLYGQITPSTTQLELQETPSGSALSPGEQVLIHAGVNTTDPVEAFMYIPATVSSFNAQTNVVTFTAPLGKTIPVYANTSALQAEVDPSLWFKIDEWGTWNGGNYAKGFGYHHGLERYTDGVFVSNVTINDLTIICHHSSTPATVPLGCFAVEVQSASDVTLNRYTINDVLGNGLQGWRAFNLTTNDAKFTGSGFIKVRIVSGEVTTDYLAAGQSIYLWGGDNYAFKNTSVSGNNIAFIASEITPRNVLVDGLNYNATFTNARNYPSGDSCVGFYGIRSDDPKPSMRNAMFSVRHTGGSAPAYFNGVNFLTSGKLTISDNHLSDYWLIGNPTNNGKVSVSGYQFGEKQTIVNEYTVVDPGAGGVSVTLPAGLYVDGRIRMKTVGDALEMYHLFGAFATVTDTTWRSLSWFFQVSAGGGSMATYLGRQAVGLNFATNGVQNDAIVEVELTYHPLLTTASGSKLSLFTGTSGASVLTSGGSPKIFNKV